MASKEKIDSFLTRGVERVYPAYADVQSLFMSGKKLRMYHGIDPTGPTLHLGHAIQLRKLGEFQRLGHTAILLIGTFTATIGDPSNKAAARVPLTVDQVHANMSNYLSQAERFLDFGGENPVQVRYNNEWFDALTLREIISLGQHATVQQMLERDMFQKRLQEGRPIFVHEFLYPLMQGYDSIVLDVDGELGGNDQTFNMLTGRTLARQISGKEKFVIATKLLVDPLGRKMGKTEGNMVTLDDSPANTYGKVMSWTDDMIIPGFELCTDIPSDELSSIGAELAKEDTNPMQLKMRLAHELVALHHSRDAAGTAEKDFTLAHREGNVPEHMEGTTMAPGTPLVDILLARTLISSKADFKRLVQEGAITYNDQKVDDFNFSIVTSGVAKVGKRKFLRITV